MESEAPLENGNEEVERPKAHRSMFMQVMSVLTAFLLVVCAVQPWNLPISFLKEDIQLSSLQGGTNGAPMTEEIQEKADNKLQQQQSSPKLLYPGDLTALLGDPRPHLIHFFFLEVPTPPPRG